MTELSKTIADGLTNSYEDFRQRAHALAGSLSQEQFWTRPYSYGNSFGHLVLHVTGNLNYYIGAQIAGTGYVRDREREFTEQERPRKAEVLRRLNEALDLVVATLAQQTDYDWVVRYEAVAAPAFIQDRFSMFLRCATHCHHHLAQMIYLEKQLKGL
jgi:hypothetical protein